VTRAELYEQLQVTLCRTNHPFCDPEWPCARSAGAAAALMPVIDSWTDGNTITRTLLTVEPAARLCDAPADDQVSDLDTTTLGGDS